MAAYSITFLYLIPPHPFSGRSFQTATPLAITTYIYAVVKLAETIKKARKT